MRVGAVSGEAAQDSANSRRAPISTPLETRALNVTMCRPGSVVRTPVYGSFVPDAFRAVASQPLPEPPLGQSGSRQRIETLGPASENSHSLAKTATQSIAPCASMRTPPLARREFDPPDPHLA